ncbi:MAG: UvrB/UvrC motif-containing protein [Gemmatimonadaceae bacterium]|nr:UvrB/UvrC motif-containing protein [Gemmatimonadaceae bacterium]
MAPPVRLHVRPPLSTPAQRRALRDLVRADCANAPGVYRMLGPTGLVLYVGQSRRLRTRLLSYFRATRRRDKAARILRHAFAIEWEYTNSEFGALLRELRLIKQHRPQFNSMMVTDDWPRAYVALTGGAVPGVTVVPRSDDPSAIAMFGPFRKVSMLREAVRALADATGLRDCALEEAAPTAKTSTLWFDSETGGAVSARRPTRTRAPGCLRHELGTCAGPCIGAGDGAAYRAQATQIRDFLEGKSDAPVDNLERAMQAASAALEFERAAVLRDRLERVRWLHQRVQHFHANMDRLTFRYHARGVDDSEWVYLVRRGTVRAEVRAPSTAKARSQLETLARRIFDGPDPSGADIPSHDLDEFYLVASWFRRRADERAKTRPAGPR